MEKQGIVSKVIFKNEENLYVVFAVETRFRFDDAGWFLRGRGTVQITEVRTDHKKREIFPDMRIHQIAASSL